MRGDANLDNVEGSVANHEDDEDDPATQGGVEQALLAGIKKTAQRPKSRKPR